VAMEDEQGLGGSEMHPMTFDRDVCDRNPEIGFMTYRQPVFEELLKEALGSS
jgi:hypothetical protein